MRTSAEIYNASLAHPIRTSPWRNIKTRIRSKTFSM